MITFIYRLGASNTILILFSRMRRRTAHQYIKKNEKGGKSPQNKNVTGIKGL